MNAPRAEGHPQRHPLRHRPPPTRSPRRSPPAAPTTGSSDLPARVMATGIGRELYRVRNVKPLWSRFGTVLGVLLGGIDMWVNHAVPLLALRHAAAQARPTPTRSGPSPPPAAKTYPRPDGKTTFDRAVLGVSRQYRPRRGPAGAPEAGRSGRAAARHPARLRRRAGAALLPRRRLRNRRRRRRSRRSASTPPTASTAKPATSRTRPGTSPGCRPRAARGPNYVGM